MMEDGDLDRSAETVPVPYVLSSEIPSPDPLASETRFERVIPRLLRNILVVSALLLVPAFLFYKWIGLVGFLFGAAVSYLNFRSLTSGVEGLAERIVNQNSQEKGAVIVFRFVVRYILVAVVAYAIFVSSPVAFRGFLWGLGVPVVALMLEAFWQGFLAFSRTS
jgi:hypothetical protein